MLSLRAVNARAPAWARRASAGPVSVRREQAGSKGSAGKERRRWATVRSMKPCRGAAKRKFSLADLKEQTAGVECRRDSGVLDEIPGAYKSIDAVIDAQSELVEVVHTLKQVMCIKG